MTSTALEVAAERLPEQQQLALSLGLPADSIHPNGLVLTDPDLAFDDWLRIGHVIGSMGRWHRFALGDWILFGEAVYGEEHAQAFESTAAERYDVAARVTGLAIGTLQNIVSVCSRVPLPRRRIELPFSMHDAVAKLEPDEQDAWLERAFAEGWERDELRAAIRDAANGGPGDPPDPSDAPTVIDRPRSRIERLEEAAALVYAQGQPTDDGVVVPNDAWHQLAAALGEVED